MSKSVRFQAPTPVTTHNTKGDPYKTVTLCVGPSRLELDILENYLRTIPYFSNPLNAQGSAASKTIELPAEQPDVVSALVEFLYTSSYTCDISFQREKHRLDGEEIGLVPSADCLATMFHLQVFILAEKFKFRELAGYAGGCSRYRALTAVEKLLVWRTWYKGQGWQGIAAKVFVSEGCQQVRAWVSELVERHAEAMENTIRMFPVFVIELLKATSAAEKSKDKV